MVLKIYGFPVSPYTRLVVLVCKEKEIPYEFVNVDLSKKEQKTSAFLQRHPFGQAPYIDDDGFVLYESRAIARYLVMKYPNQGTAGLIPTDLKEQALFEQACSVEIFHYNSTILPLAYEKIYNPIFRGQATNEAKAAELLQNFEAKLDAYETILSKQKYLAGNTLTLADLQHVALGGTIASVEPEVFEKRPNVARWWKDISNRPASQAIKDLE